jgi:predicted Zn-ribbon and HTH transcriptional regulator
MEKNKTIIELVKESFDYELKLKQSELTRKINIETAKFNKEREMLDDFEKTIKNIIDYHKETNSKELKIAVACENCGYSTIEETLPNALFIISKKGGYYISDGEGGSFSKCPTCGTDGLILTD